MTTCSRRISRMRDQLLLAQTRPPGNHLLHALPRCQLQRRLAACMLRGGVTAVLAPKSVSTLRSAPGRAARRSFHLWNPTRTLSPPRLLTCPNPHQRSFSHTSKVMVAVKIDGTAIAKAIRERLHSEIQNTQKTNPRYKPTLRIIQGISSAHGLIHPKADILSLSW